MKSSSSGQDVSLTTKVREAFTLFRTARNRSRQPPDVLFGRFEADVRQYGDLFRAYTGRDIATARIVEIGFGARPYRLALMHHFGLDATGIDLDTPILDGSLREFLTVKRNNGLERALKSIARHYVADRPEQAKFRQHFKHSGRFLDRDRIIVGDAASPTLWQRIGKVDLVTSEDVFEHIPVDGLKILLSQIARQLTDNGLALICPDIFTGITGGHILEWYHDVVDVPGKVSQPWEHLRQDRVRVNSYLNRLTRADYRTLFARDFDILEEIVREPDLGRQWFTDEVQRELAHWPEEELFSNQVVFVLRRRTGTAAVSASN